MLVCVRLLKFVHACLCVVCVWWAVILRLVDQLLKELSLFRLILLSSILQTSRAFKTVAVQPVDVVYSCLHRGTDAQGHRDTRHPDTLGQLSRTD